jgi:hypothetical protein
MKHNRAGVVLKETSKNQTQVKERLANRHAIGTHAFSGPIHQGPCLDLQLDKTKYLLFPFNQDFVHP